MSYGGEGSDFSSGQLLHLPASRDLGDVLSPVDLFSRTRHFCNSESGRIGLRIYFAPWVR